VKDIHLDESVQIKVRVVRAKSLNPNCSVRSFTLPTPGIDKYARSTIRLRSESIAGIIADNYTVPRISDRLNRCFNTTGSQSSIYRWKQKEADKYEIKDIIARLEFSDVLTLDEYMSKMAENYALIAGDAIKQRILYMESIHGFFSQGEIESFLRKLASFGLSP
jgi:uncharacterized protein involved in tolerance to divalent cations